MSAILLSIGELSNRSGVTVSAIRYYERIGLLSPAGRVSGRRRYTADSITSLLLIRLGQTAGFTLAELRILRMSDGGGPGDTQWEAVFRQKLRTNATDLERLQRAQRLLRTALACGCSDLATCPDLQGVGRSRPKRGSRSGNA
ncbi:MAG: MerR family transcriptional regulator [Gemmatimonadaceae bacterium]|nr:MerR family transcriptional regulator [Gemmatimonadaceae bacterium]MCW5827321.1 MerR family transcriptional regulator [Gemmatimonadaceae bacterium]